MTLFSRAGQSQVAQQGDDGVDREAGLQNGEDPARTSNVSISTAAMIRLVRNVPIRFNSIAGSSIPITAGKSAEPVKWRCSPYRIHTSRRSALLFPGLLGKGARSAGWGAASGRRGDPDCTIVPANLLRSSPAVHTPERLLRTEIKGLGTP